MRVRVGIELWLVGVLTALAVASPAMAARHRRPSPAHRGGVTALAAPVTRVTGIGHAVARAAVTPAGPAVSVGALPTGVALSNTRAYVANSLGNTVSVVSLTSAPAAVVATIPVGTFPIAVALSPDGSRAYVSNFRSGSLSIIDTASQTVIATVPVGTDPEDVVQIGSRVYVANFLSHSISIVDPVAGVVTATISLTGTPAPDPSGLAAAADGRHLSVDDTRNGRIDVIDISATPPAQVGGAPVGIFPAYVAISGSTAYVANPNVASNPAGTVSVVDESNPANPTVTRTVAVGSRPFGVAVLPTAGEILVTNSGDGTLSIIDSATDTVTRTLGVGRTPDAVAVSPDQHTVAITNEGDNTITLLRAPVAGPVSFSGAIGNTTFGVGTSPAQPSTSTSGSVLSHSSDPNGGALTATPGTITTTRGGSVAMSANGNFTYHPPAGVTGIDTFSFQVSNGISVATGTASVTVANRVWYVNDALATNGSGTSVSPFDALSSVTGPGGPTSAGDTVFVFGSAAPYGGGITLKAGQLLIGQSATLTVGGQTVSTATGSNPTITNSAGTGITLANGDTVTGISVANTSGTGVSAGAISTFTLSSGDTIANAGGDGLDVIGASGTISALATISGAAGHSVSVQGRTGGTVTLGGAITDQGTGIMLASNTGAIIDFAGPITASTGTHPAFQALGGGTVNVTGGTSTLATTTADALDVENTTIGAAGLTFESISAGTPTTAPVDGITLVGTGASGAITVTGVGAVKGSGGTIQNATDSSPFGGDIVLNLTGPVSLSNMVIENSPSDGIAAREVPSLTLLNNTISANQGYGVFYDLGFIDNVTGDTGNAQFDIAGNQFTGMGLSPVYLYFDTAGTVTGHVTSNVIGSPSDPVSSGSASGEGIDLYSDGIGGTVTADLSSNTITGIAGSYGILAAAQEQPGGAAPTLNLAMTGNNVDLESPAAADGINVSSGVSAAAAVCLNATTNTSVSKGLAAANSIGADADGMSAYQDTNTSVFKIVGGPNETEPQPTPPNPNGVEDPQVEAFLDSVNPGLMANPSTVTAPGSRPSVALQFGTAGFTTAAACPTAPPAVLPRAAAATVRLMARAPTAAGRHSPRRATRHESRRITRPGRSRRHARAHRRTPAASIAARRRALERSLSVGRPR